VRSQTFVRLENDIIFVKQFLNETTGHAKAFLLDTISVREAGH